MAPSAEIAAAAARQELGRLEAVYGSRRPMPSSAVWALVGGAALFALLFAFAQLLVPAVVLVPLTLLGVLSYRRWAPPAGGRHVVAVYEFGFVDATPGREIVAARWDGVAAAEFAPPPAKGVVLTLATPGSARVWLTGLHQQQELAARLAQRVPAPGLAGAVQVRSQDRRGAIALGVLALAPAVLYPIVGAFDGGPAASSSNPASTPTAIVAQLPSPTPSPELPFAYDSRDVSGYSSVCGGRYAFSGAAEYAGKGPHPIAFFASGKDEWRSGLMVTDNDNALDKWQAKTTVEVQLVACIVIADGPTIRSCGRYGGGRDVTVTLKWGDYTITVYEAKTGRKVVGPLKIRGRQANECPTLIRTPANSSQHIIRTELAGAQLRAALARYLG